MKVTVFLMLMGSILLLGVLGNFFFSRIRIPNSVILMVVGILIGPVGGFLNGSDFQQVAPFFGTIALILILFEGGLEIDIYEAVGQASSAFLLGLVHFTLAVLGVCFVGVYLFDQEPLTALLYGFVLGGTSPAVVMPVLTNIKMEAGGRALYSLETVVVEVLTVVSTVLAVDFSTSLTPPALVEASFFVLHAFGTAAGIAVLAAWAWNWVMPIVEKSGMSHLVTLAFLFILYAFAASIHAEPAITILVFGLLLENGHYVSERLRHLVPSKLHRFIDFPVKNDQHVFSRLFIELSFLVRTFFFVVMGLLFDFKTFTMKTYLIGAALLIVFYGSRELSLKILPLLSKSISMADRLIGKVTIPRGLATAVMALMVHEAKIPGTENLVPLAFLSILGTNLLMVLLLRRIEAKQS